MKQLELTPRLRQLADWVPDGAMFADIGTDHALLPVWLVLRGRVHGCIASDLRPEPLRRAKATAKLWGVSGIVFRLCDGLSGIRPEEADTITIAGLGGENIAAILAKAPWTRDGKHVLLLQPMTRVETLRRYLSENGYAIRREALVQERGILYPVMEASGGETRLTPGQWYGGAKLLQDPLGDRYLIEKIIRLQNALAGLNRGSRDPGNAVKADELRDILTELLQMREAWRHANCPRN
ncbi:MAG: SAM-dependent methyltransferase [Oscillibacter sp.]|nr:SAM-dependent methyltransferase [Oscillibacter sp.]